MRRPNFTKVCLRTGRSSQHCVFVSEFGYIGAFSTVCSSKLSDVLNDAKFCTFWHPVKIRSGAGDIRMPIVEASPTTEPPKYIWWPYSACRAVLSNGPAGPGPRAPKPQGPPNSPCVILSSREIIVANCVIFHCLNKWHTGYTPN